jgi:AcrR family transcriptional regulator
VDNRRARRGSGRGGTREALLLAGESVFSERGYHAGSVAEICHRAGLANGTFYRYFENKEEIFAALVERLQNAIRERIEIAAGDPGSRSHALIRAYRSALAFAEDETPLYQVGRSAESMQMGIHRHFRASLADALREIIQTGIQVGELRPVDPTVAAVALLGIIEFTVMRYVLWEPRSLDEGVLQTLDSFILHGFDTGAPVAEPTGPRSAPAATEDAARPEGAEATRQALLNAAERLFGDAGFHETAISGITYLAGVAQGTFYLHFPSKVAVFAELVREINDRFRREERQALAGLVDRREIEREGFQTFFRFIHAHRGAYRLLREAELVDPQTGRWYYERLAAGYTRGLRRGMDRGEIRALALEPLAYALLGIGHSVALWGLWNGPEGRIPDAVQAALLDVLRRGLAVPAT